MKIFKIAYTLITWVIMAALIYVNVTDGKVFEVIAIMANALALIAIFLALKKGRAKK